MPTAKLIATVLIACVIHAFVLRVAAKLMVEVSVVYRQALRIVAVEYVTGGVILGLLLLTGVVTPTAAFVIAAIALVLVGAICIGTWVSFGDGHRLGIGNGVLIQFMQIPLAVPFIIVASFFVDSGR